jgi:hypothetical protein
VEPSKSEEIAPKQSDSKSEDKKTEASINNVADEQNNDKVDKAKQVSEKPPKKKQPSKKKLVPRVSESSSSESDNLEEILKKCGVHGNKRAIVNTYMTFYSKLSNQQNMFQDKYKIDAIYDAIFHNKYAYYKIRFRRKGSDGCWSRMWAIINDGC